ncbi:hypothetical protein GRF59_05245 [Paenibacillus sp. HJL G12]|uniref:DUF4179 domain-containing protein n=1 Tax=Paenibacillus dendrobii TaxID=2691084 RepID=A0A7X3LH00_9BACL|nr:DUF4179 domain-containing protein [Paenibacillus dendrobii]MWV43028.1 hypothetical protein [Paenibacillus dendrobii]
MKDIYALLNDAHVELEQYEDEDMSELDKKRIKKGIRKKLHPKRPMPVRYGLAVVCIFLIVCMAFATNLPVKALSEIPFFRMLMAEQMKSDPAVLKTYSTTVGQKVSEAGIDIRLDDVLVGEGQLLISYTIHSSEVNLQGICSPWMSVYLNGSEIPQNGGGKESRVDSGTYTFVGAIDLPDHTLTNKMNIQIVFSEIRFQDRDSINGDWGFAIETSAEKLMSETKKIDIHHTITLDNGQTIQVSELVLSPISTTVYYVISGGNEWDMVFLAEDQSGKSIQPVSGRSNTKSNFIRFPALSRNETKLRLTPVIMPGAESEDHVLKREVLKQLSFSVDID